MKFAKELESQAVPEWRGKYLDYKGGKKKLKAVARAIRNVDKSSKDTKTKAESNSPFSSLRDAPVRAHLSRTGQKAANGSSQDSNAPFVQPRSRSAAPSAEVGRGGGDQPSGTQAIEINDRSPLKGIGRNPDNGPHMTRYGSIIGSPPEDGEVGLTRLESAPSLRLPEAALDQPGEVEERHMIQFYDNPARRGSSENAQPPTSQLAHRGNAYQVTKPVDGPLHGSARLRPKRTNSTMSGNPAFVRRIFSVGTPSSLDRNADVALEAYREVDFRHAEFFLFLDKELMKIETFYKAKEDEANERLKEIREQLHIMRNRRLEEVLAMERRREENERLVQNGLATDAKTTKADNKTPNILRKLHPFTAGVDYASEALSKVKPGHVGKTSEAMERLATPPFRGVNNDYERRPAATKEVPYRTAKRKLKIAMAEFYRSLELLKSYALLNRTAFRKINKKFDKTVKSRPTGIYMNEKVNTAYFVTSEVLDHHIQAVEDLYARYFERGSHKIAVGKLRAKSANAGDYAGSTFRTGLLLATGAVFGIQGLVYGVQQDLNHDDPVVKTRASYLLQIYGGYFLALLLASLFCIDAGIFTKARVNYQFIFEFDTRHMLDWRQMAELPALFFFLLGVTMWLNFSRFGGDTMYIYWPVILIGVAVILLFSPPPLLYSKSRGWFLYSHWRLLFAGLYPVEFRDFFLGDMFCSLTYAMGNLELFFCLYAHHWMDENQCNSSHSHLLGFFTALPGIWRLFQCFRRYRDTKDWFPHLVNGGKYSCTILTQVTLSLYRMNHITSLKSLYIAVALINAIYCTIWDLIMDWSFSMNPYAKPPLLRPTLAYRHRWMYYAAIAIDPIIRFNWIFYAIFTEDTQHSTAASFFISLTEVLRRGIWILFRVENEHCTNVGRYRAVRNAPLPYRLETSTELPEGSTTATDSSPDGPQPQEEGEARMRTHSTATDLEQGTQSSVRQRRQSQPSIDSPVGRALRRAGTTMLSAHARDYERKKPTEVVQDDGQDETDEEEEDDEDSDT